MSHYYYYYYSSSSRSQGGQATTEVVLVTPVLLLVITAVIQLALWYHASAVAKAAAEEGVRAARVENSTASAGQQRAEVFLAQAGPTIVASRSVTASRNAEVAAVRVRGVAISVVPGVRLPIDAHAQASVERFRADGTTP